MVLQATCMLLNCSNNFTHEVHLVMQSVVASSLDFPVQVQKLQRCISVNSEFGQRGK